jgi:glutamate formiminotransferase/formiminotetrahydrofolate cyclodeaminase
MASLIECVPNFSEGINKDTIKAIANAIEGVEGVKLLHQDSGEAANRTVFTFAGEADAVIEAAYQAISVAVDKIDMQQQKGEHPRIGACDVCPFIPITGIQKEELNTKVKDFARRVNKDFGIPIYLYEYSAMSMDRSNLASHRIGNYEALEERIAKQIWSPDIGESFNAKSGGMVCGVRDFLVAYNINLDTKDVELAKNIAGLIRESGNKKNNNKGLLKKVKAIGWYISDFDKCQVSINLTDYKTTSLYEVFETTKEVAKQFGVKVTGSELIGLIPKEALILSGKKYLSNSPNATDEDLIMSSIEALGLSEIKPFEVKKRLLEYLLNE